MKNIFVLFLAFIGAHIFAADFYVDAGATAGGDGTSASPFADIQSAVNAAEKGDTIKLKGCFLISQASQCVIVPSVKPELTFAKWGEENFTVEAHNDFMQNVGFGTNIITVCAQSNTISGVEFVYHTDSLGKKNYGRGSFIFFCTNYQTIAGCKFYRPQSESLPGYDGVANLISGTKWGGSKDDAYGQNHITIKECVFENIYGSRLDVNKYPIKAGNHLKIESCVFSNCHAMAYPIQNGKLSNYSIVSNVFIQAPVDNNKWLASSKANAGIFSSGYHGFGKGEFAHNVFIGNDDGVPLFYYGRNDGFNNGVISFHHNTVLGFDCILAGGGTETYGANQILFEIVDNVLDLNVIFFENSTISEHQLSAIKGGSFLKNNAICLTNNSVITSGAAVSSETYNLFDKLAISGNIFLASAPVFIETEDISSTDFFRPHERDNPSWIGKGKYAWTNEGVFPDFIGAVEPAYSVKGFAVKIR